MRFIVRDHTVSDKIGLPQATCFNLSHTRGNLWELILINYGFNIHVVYFSGTFTTLLICGMRSIEA